MVFCCLAILGIAVLYFTFLALRHLAIGPRRDRKVSNLPAPPRALTGNAAQPVFGHTMWFTRLGGDLALRFPKDMREWRWLPHSWSRKLGEVFSIFIWGEWRIVVSGPERAKKVLDSQNITDGWPWTPPVTLLGKSCIPLLEEDEADFLMGLLRVPLSQSYVIRHAPEFAEIAEKFMDDLVSGELNKKFDTAYDMKERWARRRRAGVGDTAEYLHDETTEGEKLDYESEHTANSAEQKWLKVKWDAMRSYTLDLIDGPVLGMNKWNKSNSEQSHGEATTEGGEEKAEEEKPKKSNKEPDRARMMLWMDRLKVSLCSIKIPMGPEWLYLWPLTEYGRATIGRYHLEEVISKHVAERSEQISHVHHDPGHFVREAALMPFPLITWAENIYYRNEGVTGTGKRTHMRERSQSEPVLPDYRSSDLFDEGSRQQWKPTLSPTEENSVPSIPSLPPSPARGASPSIGPPPDLKSMVPPNRARAASSPQLLETSRKTPAVEGRPKVKKPVSSILDHMLSQHDSQGAGISQAVATELSILLYMIMDAGNAWTSMALNLLALDPSALSQVEDELTHLSNIHGRDKLFTPRVLGQMRNLDALIFEAIRLCPPFLGGMKVVSETIVLEEDSVQIPKNSNVIFCQPTERPFDLSEARGKKAQELTFEYPCINIHGFLPFKGLEIPLMVLQTKIFIIVLLQRFEPHISRKRTFIRRVKDALHKSVVEHTSTHERTSGHDRSEAGDDIESGVARAESPSAGSTDSVIFPGKTDDDVTTSEAMRLFTKIPFPEPRVVLHVQKRET